MKNLKRWLPFLLVFIFWVTYIIFFPEIQARLPIYHTVKAATLGDASSSLSVLFSGLAFVAIISSLYLQFQEIRSTKEDLAIQRQQYSLQIFENSFYQLLNFNNQIKANLIFSRSIDNAVFKGLDAFRGLKSTFYFNYLETNPDTPSGELYKSFYLKHAHEIIGHYFRNLYQIVKLVDNSHVDDKKYYVNIVRAQLSSNELYLLFYNGLSSYGKEKFFPYLQKYAFFEHLPVMDAIRRSDTRIYGAQAFGESPEWSERFASRAS